jgi:hypothetical protein
LITSANLPTDYLVIFGLGGVFVAIFTLKSIHHQAVQVRKQTRIFKQSADGARDNIALVISKERGRIGIGSVSLQFIDNFKRQNDPIPFEYDRIEFKVMCFGTTLASIMSADTQVSLSQSPDAPNIGTAKEPMSIPEKINPITMVNGIDQIVPIVDVADEIVKKSSSVDKFESFLHLRVFIKYSDLFQTKTYWELESRRVWKVTAFRRSTVITSMEYSRIEEEKEAKRPN